jgi:hypothetical protein
MFEKTEKGQSCRRETTSPPMRVVHHSQQEKAAHPWKAAFSSVVRPRRACWNRAEAIIRWSTSHSRQPLLAGNNLLPGWLATVSVYWRPAAYSIS